MFILYTKYIINIDYIISAIYSETLLGSYFFFTLPHLISLTTINSSIGISI